MTNKKFQITSVSLMSADVFTLEGDQLEEFNYSLNFTVNRELKDLSEFISAIKEIIFDSEIGRAQYAENKDIETA